VIELVSIPGIARFQALAVAGAATVVRLKGRITGGICGPGHILFGAAIVSF
jgi:hypothetical protein